ncbi:uncharacterized protein LOC128201944 [Galleria mellonella]|uniref:Uncharacterized protein LOC128201944 n=1 Tax=Galleria mellonella TaxID=7137 RepID=A0ABM3MYG2_GALME|nr:uncharacterized protein LOC128201944 [Galleria mellonella]
MLCRAVLSAVAITCTFCREIIAQPNPLDDQRIVQIKDLICVLWLSGLQKEDLDLNMLRKLERHKLNIDDMNNETLRQECITPNISKATNLTQNENEETTISSPNLNDRKLVIYYFY